MQDYINAAEQVSLFCRININTKRNLPIRASEMGLLIYLCKTDGEKTPMGAARFFKVTKANATNMVSSLVRQGYLQKEQSREDRRSFLLVPTEKAMDLVERTYMEYYKIMEKLKENMGNRDFETFISLIEKANSILLEENVNG